MTHRAPYFKPSKMKLVWSDFQAVARRVLHDWLRAPSSEQQFGSPLVLDTLDDFHFRWFEKDDKR